MSKPQLDSTFFEKVIMFNALTSEPYLASVIDHIEPRFFENKNIQSVIGLIQEFFEKRGSIPTLTEIKSYLTTPELKEHFKAVVGYIQGFDKKFNKDELYETAVGIIKSEGKASTSFLQRKLQIGYNRAARIIDMMEDNGIVSKANHVGKRDVLKS